MTKITIDKDKYDDIYLEVSSNSISFHRVTRNFPQTIFFLFFSALSFLMLMFFSLAIGLLIFDFCNTHNLWSLVMFILFLAVPIICGAFSLWALSMALSHHASLGYKDGDFYYSAWPWCIKNRKIKIHKIIIFRVYSRGDYGIAATLNYSAGIATFFLQDHILLEPVILGKSSTSRKIAYKIKNCIKQYFPELMVKVCL